MSMLDLAIEVTGWIAALLILGAYALITAGKLNGESAIYQGLNAAGAACFVLYLSWKGAWPSVALNVVWFLIGAFALWRIVARRRKQSAG